MNELKIIENQNQRVMLTSQLSESYGTTDRRIVDNFNSNKERYQEGKHYYCLQGEGLKAFKSENGNWGFADNLNKLYLWTEKGAMLHAKSLNTDKAWEMYDILVDTYFKVKELTQPKLPTNYVEALESLISSEKEKIQLVAKIEQDKPYTDFGKTVEVTANSIQLAMFSKTLCNTYGKRLGRNKLFDMLRSNGYLYRVDGYNVPLQRYINEGYFSVNEDIYYTPYGEARTRYTTMVTGKGQIYLAKKIADWLSV